MDEDKEFPIVRYSVSAMLLLALLVGITFAFTKWQMLRANTPANIGVAEHGGEIVEDSKKGRVYITAVEAGPVGEQMYFNAYIYDTEFKKFEQAYPEDMGGFEVFHTFSPNKKMVAFAGLPLDEDLKMEINKLPDVQIYVAPIEELKDFPKFEDAIQLTSGDKLKRIQQLSVNNSGEVLFVAKEYKPGSTYESGISDVDSWGIYIADGTNDARELARGTQPKWVNEKQFVYIGRQGVSVYNLDTKESAIIAKYFNLKWAKTNIKLDLSDDKKIVLWTNPDMWLVSALRVKDWDTLKVTELGSSRVQGFWPVIAPGSSAKNPTFALQKANFTSEANNKPSALGFFDLRTLREEEDLATNLSNFYQDMLFVTDWR